MGCLFQLILILSLLAHIGGTDYPAAGQQLPDCNPDADVSDCACSEGERPFGGSVRCSIIYSGATRLVQATVKPLHCMTYDWDSEQLVTGKCPLAEHPSAKNLSMVTVSDVTRYMCGPTNHNGTLCGACTHVN